MNITRLKNTFYLITKQYFLVLFFLLGLVFSQDPPEEFNYNISIYQSFYFFITSDIDGNPLDENEDWIASFNEFDETMGGQCEYIGHDIDDNQNTLDCQDVNEDGFDLGTYYFTSDKSDQSFVIKSDAPVSKWKSMWLSVPKGTHDYVFILPDMIENNNEVLIRIKEWKKD